MNRLKILAILITFLSCFNYTAVFSDEILIPMDKLQSNHLKAYGLTFSALKKGYSARWLLKIQIGASKKSKI